MRLLLLLSVFLVAFASLDGDLYLVIRDGEVKCFIEDLPKDTLVVSTYRLDVLDPGDKREPKRGLGYGLQAEVSDPHEYLILEKVDEPMTGRFAFTTAMSGEHTICFKTNTSSWFGHAYGEFKFYIDIDSGARAQNYEKIAKLEHLNEVDLTVRQLIDVVTEIRAEQKYLKLRESNWRLLADEVHSSVVWWAVAQLVILFASGLFQVRYLRNYFKSKKLV